MDNLGFLKNKKIVVMGLGRTGVSVLKRISKVCSSLVGVDNSPDMDSVQVIKDTFTPGPGKPEILTGRKADNIGYILEDAGLMVISPGIPASSRLVKAAVEIKIPIWSELELGWRLLDEKEKKNTIAVTGTNGKTTAVSLLGKIFDTAGIANIVCGNVGLPLIDTVEPDRFSAKKQPEFVRVIEVSSFQMEWTDTFKPKVAVILNITSDHMDRHGSMDVYGSLKFRLSINQDKKDYLILNIDDPFIISMLKSPAGRITPAEEDGPKVICFSLYKFNKPGLFYREPDIFYDFESLSGKLSIGGVPLKGIHNISNIMASAVPALLFGISDTDIEKAVRDFKPLGHRMEYLGEVNYIRCINDSKSTNPDATIAAISDFKREITLIMGGRDKNMDFSMLINNINKKVKNLILIGETAPVIYALLEGKRTDFRTFMCSGLEEAVRVGFEVSSPGDVLMLSPACASMDMFRDYRERGDRFRDLVMEIKAGRDEAKGKQI